MSAEQKSLQLFLEECVQLATRIGEDIPTAKPLSDRLLLKLRHASLLAESLPEDEAIAAQSSNQMGQYWRQPDTTSMIVQCLQENGGELSFRDLYQKLKSGNARLTTPGSKRTDKQNLKMALRAKDQAKLEWLRSEKEDEEESLVRLRKSYRRSA